MTLAIHGGPRGIPDRLRLYKSIGDDEVAAAYAVLESGSLSRFVGSPGEGFWGGPQVRAFEEEWADRFEVRSAIAVNSWTSGLECAVAALQLDPGDEVITSPWTMSGTVAAIVHAGAVPVFADVDHQYFSLNPIAVEAVITPRTRAILAVDIFGQAADSAALKAICHRHGLHLLHDAAQSPGVRSELGWTGCSGDIGGFSLNYHKHIHTGEGGMLVTDSSDFALKLAMLRNHGENLVAHFGRPDLSTLVGHNFRLGEIEAAIGRVQLRRMNELVESRIIVAEGLRKMLKELPGVSIAPVRPGCQHAYYVLGLTLDHSLWPIRDAIVSALAAEGFDAVLAGYQNLHQLPIFSTGQYRQAYPWIIRDNLAEDLYHPRNFPIADELHRHSFIGIETCAFELEEADVLRVGHAFEKVWEHLDDLSPVSF